MRASERGFALQDRTRRLWSAVATELPLARTEVDCLSVWALGNYPCSQEKPGASPRTAEQEQDL